uniref:DNA repair protein RecO n=1 Tax=Candidatus Kentrum sp. FM TaxID=2126340 RepID=A0A450VWT0_9GAMM|nr:MAG: DNA repair protein RecO (recombination protein O) [Candidatus Kentron sp. FM]VFJ66286.1 MAG: DNA repair protein RecO (recombination protein O) [Candidatus Kentron sp. FM]VFK09247.1 MAG: DNA repair protein RecO (recombination protein O) [Candidatus Kentron sp. FM]
MRNERILAIESAFVLNRRPYRETSLLVEAFTEKSGRVGLVAKGARRGKMPLAAVLEPFRPLLLSWRGSGEIFTLTLAESDESPRLPRILPAKSGFYVNELLLRLLHRNDPYPGLFENYRQVLQRILSPEQEQPALRIFEKRLLAAIGYGLSLDRDADSGLPVVPEKNYRYRAERGFVEHDSSDVYISQGSTNIVRGSTLIALDRETLRESEQLREAKYLMRAVLRGCLGQKPLASRMLYR